MSTEEWEAELGRQVRRARLSADIDQKTLARTANVSHSALRALEAGTGSSLRTLVRVIRALDRTDWLESLEPPAHLSPLEILRASEGHSEPQRASRRRAVEDS
ncbi:hypothetical protein GCM10009808_26720 [Microbacterium sediminicola]|uniref:HTH cro/C1-type domain-containing protein n=1 Tax=Microbacterium sediminicola TaxID=415210 RepID=A0ABP4UKY3_9MICO